MRPNNCYQLDVDLNYAFRVDNVHAWIDYNQGGSFTEDERISMSDPSDGGASSNCGVIAFPGDVLPGETTLRVRLIYSTDNPKDTSISRIKALFREVGMYRGTV